ncbi:hypothetical protein ACEUEG_18485 [Aeromonas media]|uniref:hypothetical protein n=1 Tax=Aeromonas media TaxID=651 RepID=UPI0038D202D9
MKTVSNRIALHCLNHWQREGRDPAQLLQAAGIAREELLLPQGRIDAQRHFRLLTRVAPLTHGALCRLPAAGEPLLQRRHPAPGPALLSRLPPPHRRVR